MLRGGADGEYRPLQAENVSLPDWVDAPEREKGPWNGQSKARRSGNGGLRFERCLELPSEGSAVRGPDLCALLRRDDGGLVKVGPDLGAQLLVAGEEHVPRVPAHVLQRRRP